MKKEKRSYTFVYYIIAFLLVAAYLIFVLVVHKPRVNPTITQPSTEKSSLNAIVWPPYGEAAVGVKDYGVVAQNGENKSVPIASIAKVMLARAVLEKMPLSVGQQGPMVTMTEADAKLYSTYLAQNGSLVPVNVGEQISEYQLLQALLLPSGDNIADTLAIWAFGSVENYLTFANDEAVKLGLTKTHFADAGGLSPQTVSSARDLVVLGTTALDDPVLAAIVSQSQATLPIAGVVRNYNSLLGTNNVVGIKTGNSDEAGGCLLFASTVTISGQSLTQVGAILGATTRSKVLQDTTAFLQTNTNIIQLATVIKTGQVIGSYKLPWGGSVDVVASKDISVMATKANQPSVKIDLKQLNAPTSKDSEVGTITVSAGSETITVPAILADQIVKPSNWWKLVHP